MDHVPGPRGPVTFEDLCLRQYVITPAWRHEATVSWRGTDERSTAEAPCNQAQTSPRTDTASATVPTATPVSGTVW